LFYKIKKNNKIIKKKNKKSDKEFWLEKGAWLERFFLKIKNKKIKLFYGFSLV